MFDPARETPWKIARSVPGRPIFGAQYPPLTSSSSKKPTATPSNSKEEDTFAQYSASTDDAWDIDGRTMTLKMLETDDSLEQIPNISKQAIDEVASRVIEEHKSKNQSSPTALDASSVRRSSSSMNTSSNLRPGMARRIDTHSSAEGLVPLRFVDNDQMISSLPQTTRSSFFTKLDIDHQKADKFREILDQATVDLSELRKASWNGIPKQFRAQAWKLLCVWTSRSLSAPVDVLLQGYLPAKFERREEALSRKRDEYWSCVQQFYLTRTEGEHQTTFRQIQKDIPRMNSLLHIFQQVVVQESFERILFIWAIRHPASGYVQGINDLITPFFVVFLSEFIQTDIENVDIGALPESARRLVEADSFWATSYLLEGIQDDYTFAQPGIQQKVRTLEELIRRLDDALYRHLKEQQIEFLQFAFRWMNNLLMRELPVQCTIQLWDTYLAEQDGFSHFHLYICAALLIRFSKDLLHEKDFQGLLLLLQNLPTKTWTSDDIRLLTAEAYRVKVMFANAPRHLSKS